MPLGFSHVFHSASRQLCRRKSKTAGSWDLFWHFWSLARTEPRTFLTSGEESRSLSFLTCFSLFFPSLWMLCSCLMVLLLFTLWIQCHPAKVVSSPPTTQKPQVLALGLWLWLFLCLKCLFLSVHCQVLNAFFLLVIHVQHKTDHFGCMVNCH